MPTPLPPNRHIGSGGEPSHLFVLDLISSCLFSFLNVPYELFSLLNSQSDGKTEKGDAGNGRKDRQSSYPGSSTLTVVVSSCLLLGVDENCSASTVLNVQNEASGITSFQINKKPKTSAYTSLVISSKTEPR